MINEGNEYGITSKPSHASLVGRARFYRDPDVSKGIALLISNPAEYKTIMKAELNDALSKAHEVCLRGNPDLAYQALTYAFNVMDDIGIADHVAEEKISDPDKIEKVINKFGLKDYFRKTRMPLEDLASGTPMSFEQFASSVDELYHQKPCVREDGEVLSKQEADGYLKAENAAFMAAKQGDLVAALNHRGEAIISLAKKLTPYGLRRAESDLGDCFGELALIGEAEFTAEVKYEGEKNIKLSDETRRARENYHKTLELIRPHLDEQTQRAIRYHR